MLNLQTNKLQVRHYLTSEGETVLFICAGPQKSDSSPTCNIIKKGQERILPSFNCLKVTTKGLYLV